MAVHRQTVRQVQTHTCALTQAHYDNLNNLQILILVYQKDTLSELATA